MERGEALAVQGGRVESGRGIHLGKPTQEQIVDTIFGEEGAGIGRVWVKRRALQ